MTLTPAALVGGHVAIINGKGAGQMRTISGITADTITVGTPWTTQPNNASEWVAVAVGESITLWADEMTNWMNELETVYATSLFQQSNSVLDVREAIRMFPHATNVFAADNHPHNGVGTGSSDGNIYYGVGGFHRVRQRNVIDQRLPVDGTGSEPFAVVSGVVDVAGPSSLSDTGAFFGKTFTAAGINFTYDHPDNKGEEYIVQITAGERMIHKALHNNRVTAVILMRTLWDEAN